MKNSYKVKYFTFGAGVTTLDSRNKIGELLEEF